MPKQIGVEVMYIDRCADFIIRELNSYGYEAYLVGGCVRDSLLKRPVHDWDICTSALPQTVYDIFGNLGITVVDTGMKYGTVSVLISPCDIDMINQSNERKYSLNEMDPQIYEITTFRKASGSRKMDEVQFTESLEEDLIRRDFTMNALAYHPDKGLIDIVGGKEDINNKLIRCIEEPEIRFAEDYLRILRAIRFQAQLGFSIEENTYYWINELVNNINNASAERIQSELFKMLASDYVVQDLIDNKHIIATLLPELKDCIGFDQNNPNHRYDVYDHSIKTLEIIVSQGFGDVNLRLAALLHDIGKPVTAVIGKDGFTHFYNHACVGSLMAEKLLRRLNCTNETIKEISLLIKYHDFSTDTKSGVKRALNKVGNETFNKILTLRHADILAQSGYNIQIKISELQQMRNWFDEIIENNEAFSISDLEISGKDLIDMGYTPGKQFGTILSEVFDLVMDGEISNTRKSLVDYINNHYNIV